jgi:hypothetical protein
MVEHGTGGTTDIHTNDYCTSTRLGFHANGLHVSSPMEVDQNYLIATRLS